MALARDTSTDGISSAGQTSYTLSHTTGTLTDGVMLVNVTATAGDVVSGVTYNGVAMTLVTKKAIYGQNPTSYVFKLVNPASGAHNVVASSSSGTYFCIRTTTYSGADQTNPVDAYAEFANTTANNSETRGLTTNTDNAWVIATGSDLNRMITASAGWADRVSGSDQYFYFDTDGPVTPAGTKNITISTSDSSNQLHATIMVAIKPAAASSAIKTWNGLANVSVKSANGLARASVKNKNGLA